ncbi:MAG: ABC transporter ATP-binding protein [Bacteroidota bacterium]
MTSPLGLELAGLRLTLPRRAAPILDRVSFRLAPGEKAALLGLNGSGKTTLLLAAAGLLPYEGSVILERSLPGEAPGEAFRRLAGLLFSVPDDQILFPRVLEDVAFPLIQRGMSRGEAEERSRRVLRVLDAEHLADLAPYRLSHGERLRVALAGVMAPDPGLLLLDEPSTSLDPPGKKLLAGFLRETPATVLVATHDLPFVVGFCTRFIVLDGGRIAEDTSRAEALAFAAHFPRGLSGEAAS